MAAVIDASTVCLVLDLGDVAPDGLLLRSSNFCLFSYKHAAANTYSYPDTFCVVCSPTEAEYAMQDVPVQISMCGCGQE